MIENLKSNLIKEKKIIKEVLLFEEYKVGITHQERIFFDNAIHALVDMLKILDNSVPEILESLGPEPIKIKEKVRKVKIKKVKPKIAKVGKIAISAGARKKFLEELKIEKEAIGELRKKVKQPKQKLMPYTGLNSFALLSSKYFGKVAFKQAKNPFFKRLNKDLRKANMPYLLNTYIAIIFFSTLIATVVGFVAALIFFLFTKMWVALAIVILLPLITFFLVYLYPISQASTIKNKMEDELPFAIMHMSAIAGSGVAASKIFEIIALSSEYPNISKETKKIINQLNFYGYDLTTALRETAKTTSSKKLTDLFNGMATTITSGGNLQNYLEKSASDSLLDYKLRRKKYTASAATYAEIYVGLLIAAPLIFMLMLMLINVMGSTIFGMSAQMMATIGLGTIIVLNIAFIVFLHVSQPPG